MSRQRRPRQKKRGTAERGHVGVQISKRDEARRPEEPLRSQATSGFECVSKRDEARRLVTLQIDMLDIALQLAALLRGRDVAVAGSDVLPRCTLRVTLGNHAKYGKQPKDAGRGCKGHAASARQG